MYNQGNFNRNRPPEQLMEEGLLMQIPSDPQESEIIEILSKNPTVISYLQNLMAEKKNAISMKKLLLDKKRKEYDVALSEVRVQELESYKKSLLKHLKNEPNEVRKLCEEFGLTKTEAKEIIRLHRPDKPTANDLRDISLLKTNEFYQEEILPLEREVIELEKKFDNLKVKYDLFKNNFRASQSIKGLIQNEQKY